MISGQLMRQLEALQLCLERDPASTTTVPLATKSLANQRGHWAKKSGPAKKARDWTSTLVLGDLNARGVRLAIAYDGAVVVRLVRIAPRELDTDNLAGALKSVRDGVADALGVDDRSSFVVWLPDQEKGPAAVRVEVYAR